ncbi:hypothetical protein Tco_0914296 [Tanacetum coccineum]
MSKMFRMITQLTDAPSGNNTESPGSIIEPLVPNDRWSQETNHIELVNFALGRILGEVRAYKKRMAANALQLATTRKTGIVYDETLMHRQQGLEAIAHFLALPHLQ